MRNAIIRFVTEERGQDLIEYAFLATFIAMAAFVGVKLVGSSLENWYASSASGVSRGAAAASGITF
jgi:Flp pilus assembly pilin Flp